MNLKLTFSLLLIAIATEQINTSPVEISPINSIVKSALVYVIEAANKGLKEAENYANNYFVEKLKNETEIQEWSVNIQSKVATGVVKLAIGVFEEIKLFIKTATVPTALETKVLDCISKQENQVLDVVENATRTNGWCNNRLAANLTRAFQETSSALLRSNQQFKELVEKLDSCSKSDDACVTDYVSAAVEILRTQETGDPGTVHEGFNDVIAIYKIMFGQDVPACNKKYLFPLLADGLRSAGSAVLQCILQKDM